MASSITGPLGWLTGPVLSVLYHTAVVCTVSLVSNYEEVRKGEKILAGEIKISEEHKNATPLLFSVTKFGWGLLFIFLFMTAFIFLSPFPPARHTQSIAFDLERRIL